MLKRYHLIRKSNGRIVATGIFYSFVDFFRGKNKGLYRLKYSLRQ